MIKKNKKVRKSKKEISELRNSSSKKRDGKTIYKKMMKKPPLDKPQQFHYQRNVYCSFTQ